MKNDLVITEELLRIHTLQRKACDALRAQDNQACFLAANEILNAADTIMGQLNNLRYKRKVAA